ncbi:hypothetical protein EVAR_91906_1 [Eumeta japonica]|uniref:Uncharacterized protein n=1 Tax=Eumeta variegata TaxID=151549 RepID=A0A4C1T157_EUMVA|nr:hypothetical protein EVAR_91906_1 [Eumeta japonica]
MSENSIDIALVQETYVKPIGLKPAASQAMSSYERTGHTVIRGVPLCTQTLPFAALLIFLHLQIWKPRVVDLASGHSTLVIVSVYLPSPKRLLRRDLRAPLP